MRCEKHVQSPFQLVLVNLFIQILNIEPNTVLARRVHSKAAKLTSGSVILRFDSHSLWVLAPPLTTWRVRESTRKGGI